MAACCRRLHGSAKCVLNVRYRYASSITNNKNIDKTLDRATRGRINSWMHSYEDIVGLTEVREAQSKVIQAESQFMKIQMDRRAKQEDLVRLQTQLRSVTVEREKTNRVDEKYLPLITQEHTLLRDESESIASIVSLEKTEREYFTSLSAALRESHEKERTRTERTKYWSIIGSFLGVTVGVVGSTLNKHFQMRELRKIIQETHSNSEEYRAGMASLLAAANSQHKHIADFIAEVHELYGIEKGGSGLDEGGEIGTVNKASLNDILTELKRSDKLLESEIQTIKAILSNKTGWQDDGGKSRQDKGSLGEKDAKSKTSSGDIQAVGIDGQAATVTDKDTEKETSDFKVSDTLRDSREFGGKTGVLKRGEYFSWSLKGAANATAWAVGLGVVWFILK